MNRFDRGEATKRKWREPQVRAPSVNWMNLPLWLAKTVVVDVRDYDGRRRSLTTARLRASLQPRVRRPVFIVGAPRSGTSFLGGAMDALDSVSYHREPVAMKAIARQVAEGEWSHERTVRTLRLVYGTLLGVHLAGDLRMVEKTPQNAFLIPHLADAFPDAVFIHIVRDGRDVTVSYLEKPWVRQVFAWTRRRDPGGQPYGPFAPWWVEGDRRAEFESTSDMHRAIWVWRAHVEAANEGLEQVDPRRWTELRYEELHTTPDEVASRVLRLLDVHDEAERTRFRTALAQATGASIGRWREGLSDLDLDIIDREAGKLLSQLDYLSDRP